MLIYTITAYRSPQLAPAALLAWLWNPLLLTATAIGAHNDMLMLVLMLAAVLLFQRQRWLLGLLALALAAHVKLTALLLLPVLGLWLARRCGWWRAIRISSVAGVLALALSWLLYAPLGGWATLPRMLGERVRLIANSPAFVVYWALQMVCGLVGSCGMAANDTSCHRAVFRACRGAAGAVLARDWEYSQTGRCTALARRHRRHDGLLTGWELLVLALVSARWCIAAVAGSQDTERQFSDPPAPARYRDGWRSSARPCPACSGSGLRNRRQMAETDTWRW